MPTYTQYQGGDSLTRGDSPLIWGHFPYYRVISDPTRCRQIFTDFISQDQAGTAITALTDTTVINLCDGTGNKMSNVMDTSVTGTFLTARGEAGATGQDSSVGDLQFDGPGTDLDFAAIGINEDTAREGFARHGGSSTDGVNDEIWFECRIKVDSVADNSQGLFIGMAETGAVVDIPLAVNTSEILTTLDYVGWQTLTADGNALLPIFQEGGNTKVVVGTGTSGSGAGTFAFLADTWVKLGYWMNRDTIIYYVDGVENSRITVVAGDNFPDVNSLSPFFAQTLGAGSAVETNIDWIRAGYTGDG